MAKPAQTKTEVAPPAPQETTKSFSVLRRSGGWVMVTYTHKGDQIVSTESTEPDLKILALEAFKIAAYKYWTGQ